jgi:hypothetical protein
MKAIALAMVAFEESSVRVQPIDCRRGERIRAPRRRDGFAEIGESASCNAVARAFGVSAAIISPAK